MYSGKYVENIEDSNNVDLADFISLADRLLGERVYELIMSSRIAERLCGDKTGLNIWLPTNEFNRKDLAYWSESLNFPQEYHQIMDELASEYSHTFKKYVTMVLRALS